MSPASPKAHIALLLLSATTVTFTAASQAKKQFVSDTVTITKDLDDLEDQTESGFDEHADEHFTRDDYRHPNVRMSPFDHTSAYESKEALELAHRDYRLIIGGSTKIENYAQKNCTLFNNNIPDDAFYFKHAMDLTFNYVYGEKHFGHKAVEAYLDVMHKGNWGKNMTIADPTKLDFTDDYTVTLFGDHKHTTTRPAMFFREAWLQASLTAIVAPHASLLHFVRLGWFPFQLGRGISLGSAYGLTRDASGLYSAQEDKCAPGISLSGELIKDVVKYDLYYSMLECRTKGLGDTLETVRYNQINAKNPWRGAGKNNEIFAARLVITPQLEEEHGTFKAEPYLMYNAASDQTITRPADTDTKLGSVGLAIEQTYKNFEWGCEVAANFGHQVIQALDLNTTKVIRDETTGNLFAQYTKVTDSSVTTNGGKASATNTNAQAIATMKTNSAANGTLTNKDDRFSAQITNHFKGFMAVADAGYKINAYDLRLAAGGAYVSGDESPILKMQTLQKNNSSATTLDSDYHGFMSVGEVYSGTRVKSQFVLDERTIQRPIIKSKTTGAVETTAEMAFHDISLLGISALWTPKLGHKKCSSHLNVVAFWQNHADNKFTLTAAANDAPDQTPTATFLDTKARKYFGTEVNLLNNIELLKDLNLFAKFAVFIPGGYFSDMKGIPMKYDAFKLLEDISIGTKAINNAYEYRLKTNVAWHANVGLSYRF